MRAVIEVKAPPGVEIKADIPSVEEEKQGKTRKQITEEKFFEELVKNTTDATASEVQRLIQELKELGLIIQWRTTSVSLRLPDPGESGYTFTVVVLTQSGTFYLGFLWRVAGSGGYNENIANQYLRRVQESLGLSINKAKDGTETAPIQTLIDHKEAFIACVSQFISDINQAARQDD